MNTTIKDLKKLAAGTEIKGFPLFIRTARGTFRDADDTLFQEVRFMDKTGEITGHILQEESEPIDYHPHKTTDLPVGVWRPKQTLCVMKGIIQDTDERKKEGVKIVIYECFPTAVLLSYEQGQEIDAEEWDNRRQDEIKSKIRCWLVSASIQGQKLTKAEILEWQEFVRNGE